LVLAAGLVALATVGEPPGAGAGFDPERFTVPFGPLGDALVAPTARWDAVWYLTIAERGYGLDAARPAFFPLYPLLARAAGLLTGSALLGGILVSLVSFGAALYLLRRLTALELGGDAARATVWLTAAFPVAFFFSAVYSEALFLALSVGCVYAVRTDRWAWAGTLGLLATATRSAGVVLLVPLALGLWEHRGSGLWVRAPWVGLVPLGTAAFCGWLAFQGAGAMAPFDAQAEWYRELSVPFAGLWEGTAAAWDGARQLHSGSSDRVFFEHAAGDPFEVARWNLQLYGFLLLALVALVGTARRLPPAYAAYALAALALPLSTPVEAQPLMSLPRFVAVLFPLFMWGGWWIARRRRATRVAVGAAWALGLVVFTAQFTTWRWVA
ncbi:MAG: hypothetical protein M3417_04850, partial [Actinomycetota bacterium]|nr:hypothetical protein [Actinomycetota bacterium]